MLSGTRATLLAIIATWGAISAAMASAESTAHVAADAAYLKRIEAEYGVIAGSHDNLASLAYGLRTSHPVTLISAQQDGSEHMLTFTPPTGPMEYGSVAHALDYAVRDLAAAGIATPTPEQLHAALMGGTVTNAAGKATLMPGVLQLRSQGMGWRQVAHLLNIPPVPPSPATSATPQIRLASTAGASGTAPAAGTGSRPLVMGESPRAAVVNADGDSGGDAAAPGAKFGRVTAAGVLARAHVYEKVRD